MPARVVAQAPPDPDCGGTGDVPGVRALPRRGRLYQRFCADRGCRTAWWEKWWGPARQKAIEARDRWKWGTRKIAEWLSTSEYTISEATVRRLLGQPRRPGRKRKRRSG
jgi:hypothetical protein